MIVGTAGHIDHGKTTLVQALTGVDTDRLPEEKRRGITIELGFAPLALPGIGQVGVVDVPGHEGFIRTMVAGASGIDVGLLVIASDEGVMPQTREHLGILEVLGIGSVVVALTKCDLVEAEWLALVSEDVRDLLAQGPFGGAPIVPVSARTGQGLDDLRAALVTALRSSATRSASDLFRLPIDRAFTVKGTGTVVTGTSWTGTIDGSSDLRLYPGGAAVRVRGIQSHGAAVASAGPGSRLAIALGGVELEQVHRGMVLATASSWVPSPVFHAEVALLDGAEPFRPREWVRLHVGTTEVSARVVVTTPPGLARVVTEEPVVLRAGDRFVLRRSQPHATIGGGIVLDPAPARHRSRPVAGWDPDASRRIARLVDASGEGGFPIRSLAVRAGVDPSLAVGMARSLPGSIEFREHLFPRQVVDQVVQRIEGEVLAFHASHGTEPGLPAAAIRSGAGGLVIELAIQQLVAAGRIEQEGAMLRGTGWEPRLGPDESALAEWLLGRLQDAGTEPPSVTELQVERPTAMLNPVLRFLERQGRLVAVEADRYYRRDTLGGIVRTLLAYLSGRAEPVTPADFRAVLGTSRKYLMPLLEYCDRERITERRGEGRVLSSGAETRVATFS